MRELAPPARMNPAARAPSPVCVSVRNRPLSRQRPAEIFNDASNYSARSTIEIPFLEVCITGVSGSNPTKQWSADGKRHRGKPERLEKAPPGGGRSDRPGRSRDRGNIDGAAAAGTSAAVPPTSHASHKPAFEVASIKPSTSDEGTYLRRQPGGLYRATEAPLRALIASAYLNEFPPKGERIFGGPGWIDSERFDIEAKAEGNPSPEQESLMVQSLLEDRFKLVMHREPRQLPIYALVLSKARENRASACEAFGQRKVH